MYFELYNDWTLHQNVKTIILMRLGPVFPFGDNFPLETVVIMKFVVGLQSPSLLFYSVKRVNIFSF